MQHLSKFLSYICTGCFDLRNFEDSGETLILKMCTDYLITSDSLISLGRGGSTFLDVPT